MNRRPYRDRHNAFVRLASALAAGFLLFVSIMFSKDGFNMNIAGYAWVGIGMGIVVTILEFVWNEGGGSELLRANLTIALLCIAAYVYGTYTNFEGLVRAMGMTMEMVEADPVKGLFPGVLAFLLEVTPESLFVWAFDLEGQGSRDLLGNILSAFQRYGGQALGGRSDQGGFGGSRPEHRFRSPRDRDNG